MSRNIAWGEPEQKNILNLLEALLCHADEELELDDVLKTAVQVEWVSANQLRVTGKEKQKRGNRIVEVGTRKEHLVALIQKTSKRLELRNRQGSQQEKELDAIQTVIDCLRELGLLQEDDKRRKNQGYWKFTLTLQHQTASRDQNLAVVKQKWQEKTASNVPESSPLADKNINWHYICNKVLATQQLRRQATAQQYELNIYVPLGLMERPKTPNPRANRNQEDSQPQKEPELQIVQTYKDDAFFQKVIAENRIEKGKHIAIIGEPGAGKTTLLGELAERLPKNSPDLPICIRLADLRDSTIADYLLDNWLSKALQFIDADAENVTPEIRKALKQLFAEGKVWLLLDGVDEMAATSPIEALARIREQLTDWVGKARVVLTCRLNVWDAAISNTLTNFDTYKTLEFEPDDVDEFIRQWFEEASQDEKRCNSGNETFWREQGKRLQQQLREPGKERIKELVRNPLRLSMLCQSWCVAEQDLPSTKAALYEQFSTYFFEWKQEEFQKKHRVLKERDKKQIQQALAKLALAAMESVNRFRIEQDFAIEQMEEEWFNLAQEWGWLVLVDRDTRTKKPVYSFLHSSFQEYLAASAISNWHFFLNHVPANPNLGIYRIFEPQWKEVILLWLGREDVESDQKEDLINKLVGFNDGCGSFYCYRAFFIAAKGIAEFEKSASVLEIVKQIVHWSFGYLSEQLNQWLTDVPHYIVDSAKKILPETQRSSVISHLTNLLNSPNEYIRIEVAESLGQVFPGYPKAVESLIKLIQTCSIPGVRMKAVILLANIGKDNQETITHLVKLIHTSSDPLVRSIAAQSVGKIDPDHPDAILFTVTIEPNSFEESSESKTIETNYEDTIKSLISQIRNSSDEAINFEVVHSLRHLIKLHPVKAAVSALKEVLPIQVNDDKDFKLHQICCEFLWHCAQNMPYPDFYQAWHQDTLTNTATASLNIANLPQDLAEAINNQPELCSKVKLICIDTYQIIDPENPAPEIYDQMLNQNCPEWQKEYPDTMQKLKLYWNYLRRISEIPLFFICYDSTALSTPTGFSDPSLKALSKFDGAICVCEPGDIPLRYFSPSQPNLIAEIVEWIKQKIVEQ